MNYLILSVLFSGIVVILFKYFDKYKVNTFQAIVINYAVCFLMGAYYTGHAFSEQLTVQQSWLPWAALLGILFITVFNAIGWVAQKVSVATSMVAAKMSVIIPLLFAVWILGESMNLMKLSGILLSLAALYFVIGRNDQVHEKGFSVYFYPVLVFIGSGAIDTTMKFLEVNYLHQVQVDMVLTVVFGMAFVAGVLFLFRNILLYKEQVKLRHILAGIVLGIPNYFSMYFLFRTLNYPGFPATLVFPVNNIAIVLFSTLLAILLFRERPTWRVYVGLAMAVVSIAVISFS